MDKKKVVEIKGLVKNYGTRGFQTRVLKGIDLTIYENDFIAIMGPSGSGKTTLLNILSTIDKPTQGTVLLDGKDVTKLKNKELSQIRRDKIGFIFQDYNLMPALNVWENIVLPIGLDGKKVKKDFVLDIVKSIGMEERLHAMPNQLSGGQKQRVAIARALAARPAIILADEPTGNLDSHTSDDVVGLLKMTAREFHQTIVMITHNPEIAQMADRVIRIEDGRIAAD